jgi:hypothetical protein
MTQYIFIYRQTDRQTDIHQARLDETESAALKVLTSDHSDAIHTYILITYIKQAGTQYIYTHTLVMCICVCVCVCVIFQASLATWSGGHVRVSSAQSGDLRQFEVRTQ